MELSWAHAREVIRTSSVPSPEPQIMTIESDSTELTIPYEYGQQQPILPPILNDFSLQINPFDIVTIVSPAPTAEAQQYPT